MTISYLGVVLLALALCMLLRGLHILKPYRSYAKNAEEAKRIFRLSNFTGQEDPAIALHSYISKIRVTIYSTAFHFFLAYCMVFSSFFTMHNSDKPSSLLQIFLVSIFMFAIPIVIVITAFNDIRSIEDDVLIGFNPEE